MSDNIKVAIRVRPLNSTEAGSQCWRADGKQIISTDSSSNHKPYKFGEWNHNIQTNIRLTREKKNPNNPWRVYDIV